MCSRFTVRSRVGIGSALSRREQSGTGRLGSAPMNQARPVAWLSKLFGREAGFSTALLTEA
jgi:hypothetical protein